MPRPRGKNVEYDTYMNASQRAKYRLIEERARALREARVSGWEEVQRAFQEQLRHYQFSLENAVLEAWEPVGRGQTPKTGLRLSTIGRAMGTQDYGTVKRIVDKWSPELHKTKALKEFTLLPGVLAKDQPHEFVLNWATIEGVEYTVPTTWGIGWDDGMWDLLMPDSDHETEMSAAYMRAPFESGNQWRLDTARRVAEAYMNRDGAL